MSEELFCTIRIEKKETVVSPEVHDPAKVNDLQIYSDNKTANLDFLADYPNVETLFINGDFANVDGISELKRLRKLTLSLPAQVDLSKVRVPTLKSLCIYKQINPGFSVLLTDKIEYLELTEMRNLTDLSFVEGAAGLKKLNLVSLPAAEALPDFGTLPNLYALRIYELHKLNDIESLARSNIRYLMMFLAADKLSGTKIADVLLRMERLEKANLDYLDRSSFQRSNVVENKFKKSGRESSLDLISDYDEWERL